MAKTGVEYVRYSKIEDGKYTGGKSGGTLVTFNGSPNKLTNADWGDNTKVASHNSVNQINLSMELNDLQGDVYADLCGHEYDQETKKVTIKSTDNAPYVGVGAVGKSDRSQGTVYVMKFYPNVQFGDPNDDNTTQSNSITYNHTTIEGIGYPDENHILKIEQEFDTLDAAKSALDELLAAPAEAGG